MNRNTDRAIRLVLLLVTAAALSISFAVAESRLGRTPKFAVLAGLAVLVVGAGSPAIDVIQGYTKRRPLRLRWGKPRTELEPAGRGPDRDPPPDSRVTSSLRTSRLIAGLAASLAAALILGVVAYAVSGSQWPYGRSLFIYLLLALAVWSTLRFTAKSLFRTTAIEISPESVILGIGIGYVPPLVIERAAVVGIEFARHAEVMAFITAERRYEVSLSLLDNEILAEQIAGIWPAITWHDLSADTAPTSLEWNRTNGP